MLNQQGRHKAQFIVNAVLHYMICSGQPSIERSIIENVLNKMTAQNSSQDKPKKDIPVNPEDELGHDMLTGIIASVDVFRNGKENTDSGK